MPPSSPSPDGRPDFWTDALSADDLDDIFPTDAPRPAPAKSSSSVTPATLGREQHAGAMWRLTEDPAGRFRFPVPSLDALAGPVAPGELWVVGGRQGNGKSLFFQNVAAWLLDAGFRTLYMGTEQAASDLKIKQACILAGVRSKLMLKPTEEERLTEEYVTGARLVQEALDWLHAEPQVSTLTYANDRYISRPVLERWTKRAVSEWGTEVVIVDHLHHMQHGPGKNPVSELTETVHHAKGLAVDLNIVVLAASQIARSGGQDPLKTFTPPAAEDFAGASAIERTADVMLGLWRPLRMDMEYKELKELREQAKLGHTGEDRVYEANTMGVRCVKDRLGDAPGKQTMLAVASQRIGERGRDAYATDYDSMRRFGRNA